jgi:hypothetical protein
LARQLGSVGVRGRQGLRTQTGDLGLELALGMGPELGTGMGPETGMEPERTGRSWVPLPGGPLAPAPQRWPGWARFPVVPSLQRVQVVE